MPTLLAQGAEAKIYKSKSTVIKKRIPKSYRLHVLDEKLRISRTKREVKILEKLKDFVPKLISKTDTEITMEYIDAPKLRQVLNVENCETLGQEIGKKLRMIHDKGIIHGDVTTSNMIAGNQLYFIDFGLSFFSEKIEDKAVDLHILQEALESKHYVCYKKCMKAVIDAYNDTAVKKRLKLVEKRGRNKVKG